MNLFGCFGENSTLMEVCDYICKDIESNNTGNIITYREINKQYIDCIVFLILKISDNEEIWKTYNKSIGAERVAYQNSRKVMLGVLPNKGLEDTGNIIEKYIDKLKELGTDASLKELCNFLRDANSYPKNDKYNGNKLKELAEWLEEKDYKKPFKKILIKNRQMVLTGAPGTGKTYMAKNYIADSLLFDNDNVDDNEKENEKNIRVEFVQFHPSYDYTDFIEGIRPILSGDDKSNIGYKLQDGMFKEFCKKAGVIERLIVANQSITNDTIKNICINDNKCAEYWKDKTEKDKDLKNLIDKYNKSHPKNNEVLINYIKEKYRFLFIIDEINRAEISKVLGETMYCLDPDYRGVKGKVKTQYSNSASKENFYIDENDDYFFIPSNVYIVATQNDIDRSVELFDYALRRRFAWHNVDVLDTMDDILEKCNVYNVLDDKTSDYRIKILVLNRSIVNKLNLTEEYQLGGSYFAKINLYFDLEEKDTNKAYKMAITALWNNHIDQILREYTKGTNSNSIINEMRKDFISYNK